MLFVDSIYRLAYRKLDEGGSYLLETPPQRLLQWFYTDATEDEKQTLSEVHACIEQFGQGRHINNSSLGVFVLMYNVMNGKADRLHILLRAVMNCCVGKKVVRNDGTPTKNMGLLLERAVACELRFGRPFYAIKGALPAAPCYTCRFEPSRPRQTTKLYAHLRASFALTRTDTYNGSQSRQVLLAHLEDGVVVSVNQGSSPQRTDWTEREVLALKAQVRELRAALEQTCQLADGFPDY